MSNRADKIRFLTMTLEEKVQRTKELIVEWYYQFNGKVYISFSGGKDSTVLLHIARSLKCGKDIVGVFDDTGLEYPEIRDFVKQQDNVVLIKPKMNFKQVVEKYGFPIISKEQSRNIYEIKTTKSKKLLELRLGDGMASLAKKWRPLLDADFKISNRCCRIMKKDTFHKFEKETGLKPIVATMAEESRQRMSAYFRGDCNEFSVKRPISKPMSFWTEQEVLRYIKNNNIELASVYGDIVEDNGVLRTTGLYRTGCMFCMYGLHLERHPNRFEQMKKTHPKQYDYIMNKLNGKHIMNEYLKLDKRCAEPNMFEDNYNE